MKRKLNQNQISIIKLQEKEVYDIVREDIFGEFKDYGNISNRNIISSVYFIKERNGTTSIIACFQPESLYKRTQGKLINEKILNDLCFGNNLSKNPTIFTFDELQIMSNKN